MENCRAWGWRCRPDWRKEAQVVDKVSIHENLHLDHAAPRPLGHHHIVEGHGLAHLHSVGSGQTSRQQRTILQCVMPVQHLTQTIFQILCRNICQKTQPPQIDADQGDGMGRQYAGGIQQGSVPTQHHTQIHLGGQLVQGDSRLPAGRGGAGIQNRGAVPCGEERQETDQRRVQTLGIGLAHDTDTRESWLGHGTS